jgi:hypothetical protein
VVLVVFLVYTQIENHALNPVIMSKTVRISPLLVLLSVLVGASIGAWVGGIFGGFVAALLSIPAAGAVQVIVIEIWRLTGPSPEGADPGTTETVVAIKTTGTVEAVDVTVDEPDLDLDPDPDPDLDLDPDPDSTAPADGGHQRP